MENIMALFVCDRCNCVDDPKEGGNFWKSKKFLSMNTEDALCTECFTGTWHNKFEKINFNDKPFNGRRTEEFCDIQNLDEIDFKDEHVSVTSNMIDRVIDNIKNKKPKVSKTARKMLRRNKFGNKTV
jgi:hypothetical protein